MNRFRWIWGIVLGMTILQNASGQDSGSLTESARAAVTPWSGSWWPHRMGGIQKPLASYDRLMTSTAVAWEAENHPAGDSVPKWHGFCHAWAASSVLEPEPTQTLAVRANGVSENLPVGDQKGWLAACHTQDIANVYGDRFGDGQGTEAKDDLPPDELWRLLRLYLKDFQVPLILDVEAGEEVWNYPVYSYELKLVKVSGAVHRGSLALEMADNCVIPGFAGTKIRRESYEFEIRLMDGTVEPESARWIGESVANHPDFAWYPLVAVAENPEIRIPAIHEIVRAGSPGPEPPAAATSSTDSTVASEPAEPPVLSGNPLVPHENADGPEVGPGAEPARLPVLSGTEMLSLVAGKTSDFLVDLQLPTAEGQRVSSGQNLPIRVLTERAGFVTIFMVDAAGVPTRVFPNQQTRSPRLPANGQLLLEGPTGLIPGHPAGIRALKAIVTEKPVLFSDLAGVSPGQTRQNQVAGPLQSQGLKGQEFHFHPALLQTICSQLRAEIFQNRASAGQEPVLSTVQAVTGSFGQDMVLFHVDADSSPDHSKNDRD